MAFSGCHALKKVTIPSNVTKVETAALGCCNKLRIITIKSKKLKSVESKAFSARIMDVRRTVIVPKDCYKKYKKFLNRFTIGYSVLKKGK